MNGRISESHKGGFAVSENENRRSMVLSRVGQRTLTLDQASRILALSPRQVKRIWKRFREDGEQGLAHGNRGRPSNRAFPDELKKNILRKYREHALGLGPTRFAEELGEQGIVIDHETLRRWLIESDLWKLSRNRHMTPQVNRCGRGFGELLTLVSIPSNRIGAGLPAAYHLCVRDEATSITLWLLAPEESSTAAMRLLWLWIDRHGIPAALRCQRRFMLRDNRHPTLEEQLAGSEQRTSFARSCERLGIDAGVMNPSQARGVVLDLKPLTCFLESELHRLQAATFEGVNTMMQGAIGDKLNSLFATCSEAVTDYHVPIVDGTDLRSIFCTQQEQCVGPDLVIEHNHRRFRLEMGFQNIRKPIHKIVLSEWLDGSLHFLIKGMELHFQEIRSTRQQTDKLAI
jgi:transposase